MTIAHEVLDSHPERPEKIIQEAEKRRTSLVMSGAYITDYCFMDNSALLVKKINGTYEFETREHYLCP